MTTGDGVHEVSLEQHQAEEQDQYIKEAAKYYTVAFNENVNAVGAESKVHQANARCNLRTAESKLKNIIKDYGQSLLKNNEDYNTYVENLDAWLISPYRKF